ncbi:MAG: metalloregulator ArsR/SmtB family transcription factor [Acidimicrobiia bacterium]|nr:metalloregulator ArsR/SmtB family transcription factor [Acidimicrobiia bacterium]
MGDRRAKNALYDGFAQVAKALGSGRRAELVDVLAQGERHVEDLAAEIGQSVANTSHHLRALAAAGLVATRRRKTRVYYRLASDEVERLWASLRSVAVNHLDDLDALTADYVGDRRALEEISREELVRRLDNGEIALVDVRPEAEYTAGHIPGARSVPIDRLPEAVRELPTGVEVVAYCRGPYCVLADDAVKLLRRRRRRARRLEDGFPEWRMANLPTIAGGSSR